MYSNEYIIDAFYRGKKAYNKNMRSTGDKLFSYATCIAQRTEKDKKNIMIINMTPYSQSTSKHQNYLHKYDFIVSDVPIDSSDISKYL